MKKRMPVILSTVRLLAFLFFCGIISSCSSSKKIGKGGGSLSRVQKKKYALIMHVPVNKISDDKLYLFIDEWWGVKYKYGGNTRSGVDCSGLLLQLYKQVYGIDIPRTTTLQYQQSRHVKNTGRLHQGDLVFFATGASDKKTVSHVGLYLMEDCFVHAARTGVMINNLQEDYWRERYICGGRIKR